MLMTKKKKYLFVPLIVFTLLVTLAVTIVMVRLMTRFSTEQISTMSSGIVKLIQGSLERNLKEESLMVLFDFDDQGLLSKLRKAEDLYNSEGKYTFDNIFGESAFSGRLEKMKELFGMDADMEFYLLSEDGNVITSTDQGSIGTAFFPDSGDNRVELDRYLSQPRPAESLLLFDHEEGDVELDLIFPLELYLPVKEARGIVIATAFSHLNVYRAILEDSYSINDISIFLINEEGRVFLKPGPFETHPFLPDDENIMNLLKFMKAEPDSPILRNGIYKDREGNRIILSGVWVSSLETGIIILMKSSEVLAPWIYLASIILAVIIASFLLFLMVLIYMDAHRIKAYNHNPITHLPGNRIIQKEISQAMKKDGMMVIYCDLDNFKAYNDVYGFTAGDQIIAYSAQLLTCSFQPPRKYFIGHIGGDDFVVIGRTGEIEKLCYEFGRKFDEKIKQFYNEADRRKGVISSTDRQGNSCEFPFIAMSMGGVLLDKYKGVHPLKIAEICSEVKKEAKKVPGSRLVVDKRTG
jgi:diguanylate cyclase (GGDEF)-like protein